MYNAVNIVDGYIMEYYNPSMGNTNFSLEFGIVFLIFAEDVVVVLAMFSFFCIIGCVSSTSTSDKHCWSMYVYSPLGPVMFVVIHSHQILIGFIHAPYHASSVLIFYGIVALGFLYSYRVFHNFFSTLCDCCISSDLLKNDCFYTFLFFVFSAISFIFCGLLVFIVTFFVLVPIDNAIDDAPTQLFSIERTVVILAAITVTYKIYSNRSHTLLTYIMKAKDKKVRDGGSGSTEENAWDYKWNTLEEEEKYIGVGTLLLDKLN